jgi:hypothetical protein
MPSPQQPESPGTTQYDVREQFARRTAETPMTEDAKVSFVRRKTHTLRTHPIPREVRSERLATFEQQLGVGAMVSADALRPIPGGVGYGMFFEATFKTNFSTGTAISWQIVCPSVPGGNVTDWLYVTATNRAALGVEAYVSYKGHEEVAFNVYDWARPENDRFQTHVLFASLSDYLLIESTSGHGLQVLPVINTTAEGSSGNWVNSVQLWNHRRSRWDLIYQFEYAATREQQLAGWVGTWGPIVETFQDLYDGTAVMGALSTLVGTRDPSGNWSTWQPLLPSQSALRVDNKGFEAVFLDANFNWGVQS